MLLSDQLCIVILQLLLTLLIDINFIINNNIIFIHHRTWHGSVFLFFTCLVLFISIKLYLGQLGKEDDIISSSKYILSNSFKSSSSLFLLSVSLYIYSWVNNFIFLLNYNNLSSKIKRSRKSYIRLSVKEKDFKRLLF
jgi:hypothetical protein